MKYLMSTSMALFLASTTLSTAAVQPGDNTSNWQDRGSALVDAQVAKKGSDSRGSGGGDDDDNSGGGDDNDDNSGDDNDNDSDSRDDEDRNNSGSGGDRDTVSDDSVTDRIAPAAAKIDGCNSSGAATNSEACESAKSKATAKKKKKGKKAGGKDRNNNKCPGTLKTTKSGRCKMRG